MNDERRNDELKSIRLHFIVAAFIVF